MLLGQQHALDTNSFQMQRGAESTDVVLVVLKHRAVPGAGAGSCAPRTGMDRRS